MTPLLSFIAGFCLSSFLAFVFILVSFEIRKKRALAFTKRFSVISEGLSSLKALGFQVLLQVKKIRPQFDKSDLTKQDIKKIAKYVDGMAYIFENLSAGMMPPTEEIAMGAITGRKNSSEQRAYDDSIKFRNEIRQLRHKLEEEGLEGLGKNFTLSSEKGRPQMKIIDKEEL
ncbi:MAG: hypothetical protein HUU50_04865 [Candidatus Brocadiae bacterium]|nr:hypothetical protein [Candidatus Brocadiia bacterium]